MKRREFVTRSIAAGAAAWLVPGVADAAEAIGLSEGASSAPGGTAPMTRVWFERRLGSRVLLEQDGADPVLATIKAVRQRPVRKHHRHAPDTDQFSVVFALKSPSTVEGLCRMRTAADGSHEIFVSRAGDRTRMVHAHFSLLT
jgi:hypothetical protein